MIPQIQTVVCPVIRTGQTKRPIGLEAAGRWRVGCAEIIYSNDGSKMLVEYESFCLGRDFCWDAEIESSSRAVSHPEVALEA